MSYSNSSCFFKQIDEKHVSLEVKLMLWNPKMDLIALAFTNGDLHLYRMTWQKVWSVNSPQQNISITSMAWRPDGKVLAVSFSNGHLRLLAVEDAKKIFSFNCSDEIQSLYWVQEDEEMSSKHESYSFYEDTSARQLPKPISYDLISQLFEKANNRDFPDNLCIKESKNVTYLVCAHGTSIAIFVYGYFLLVDANLDLVPSYLTYKQINSCFLSDNTALVSTLGLTDENLLVYSILDSKILQENHIQIKLISTKFGMLFSMLTSIKSVIKEMEELWEDILVEMDQKFQLYALEKYNNLNNKNGANTNGASTNNGNSNNNHNDIGGATNTTNPNLPNQSSDTSLVHDFMLLYAFGSCSDHFKTFLLHELTEKGLKKLEASVENYYSNIQRLLGGNFHQITMCMFYHLNELYGMTKWFDKFKIFSFTEQRVNDALNNCASLILKAQELNFVIDQNLKEIKLFFKWLHASIIHLSDDQSATDMIRFNEEMENSILDFIQNTFKDAQTINLEKVGQYLKQENLRIQISEENNWQTFLKTKLTPKENQYLYLSKKEKSLIGCFDDFKQSLNDSFKCQAISNQQPFNFLKQYNIHKFNSQKDANDMIISYKCLNNTMITGLLMAKSNNECYILKHPVNSDAEVKAYIINLSSSNVDFSQISLQDAYIYGENSVTMLGTDLKSSSNTYLIQLNLQPTPTGILNDLIEVANYNEGNENKNINSKPNKETNLLMIKAEKLAATSIVKCIKKLKSNSLCVSSSRKVAALLLSSKNRVKLFELEVDDEEDEEMEENDQMSDIEDADKTNEKSCKYDEDETDESANATPLKLPHPQSSPSVNDPKQGVSSTLSQNLIKQFNKQQSASSSCSLAQSVCSSTAATVGTSVTLDSSSTFLRGKRKKIFDDEDDDDDNTTETQASNDNIDSVSISDGQMLNNSSRQNFFSEMNSHQSVNHSNNTENTNN